GRAHGGRGLTADVLTGNGPMMRIFEQGDHSLTVSTNDGVHELTMLFYQPAWGLCRRCGYGRCGCEPVGEVDAARCPGLRSQKLERLSLGDPSEQCPAAS